MVSRPTRRFASWTSAIPQRMPRDTYPGALSAPYGAWRGPATNPGELPPLPDLEALVRRLGLTPDTHVVVVSSGADATDFGASARVYWTLKVLGLEGLLGAERWPEGLGGGRSAAGRPDAERDREQLCADARRQPHRLARGDRRAGRQRQGDARRRTPGGVLQGRGPAPGGQGSGHHPRRSQRRTCDVVQSGDSDLRHRRRGEEARRRDAARPRARHRVVLQLRPLGGDELVRAVRSPRPERRQAVSGVDGGLVPGRTADGERAGPLRADPRSK